MTRAHGLKGDVLVELFTPREERLRPGAVLERAGGRPLEVVRSAPYQSRWLVAFAGVSDRTGAERLQGTVLLAEALADDDPETLWVHELIGSSVVDVGERLLGTVTAVEANPASDLLVLDSGALVPLTFVVGWAAGRITVDIPAGLLEL